VPHTPAVVALAFIFVPIGAVAGNVTDLAAHVALAIILFTFTGYVARFAANITSLGGVGTVSGYVSGLVAVVAGSWRITKALFFGRVGAILCDVANSVATVAAVLLLLAVTCKVTKSVALVAFLFVKGERQPRFRSAN
jgi:hypothetical protein